MIRQFAHPSLRSFPIQFQSQCSDDNVNDDDDDDDDNRISIAPTSEALEPSAGHPPPATFLSLQNGGHFVAKQHVVGGAENYLYGLIQLIRGLTQQVDTHCLATSRGTVNFSGAKPPLVWLGGRVVRTLDLRSVGREFESWPLRYRVQLWASC